MCSVGNCITVKVSFAVGLLHKHLGIIFLVRDARRRLPLGNLAAAGVIHRMPDRGAAVQYILLIFIDYGWVAGNGIAVFVWLQGKGRHVGIMVVTIESRILPLPLHLPFSLLLCSALSISISIPLFMPVTLTLLFSLSCPPSFTLCSSPYS